MIPVNELDSPNECNYLLILMFRISWIGVHTKYSSKVCWEFTERFRCQGHLTHFYFLNFFKILVIWHPHNFKLIFIISKSSLSALLSSVVFRSIVGCKIDNEKLEDIKNFWTKFLILTFTETRKLLTVLPASYTWTSKSIS